ncbi:DUF5906 domain-containing protein [Brevundimonas sp. DC300-4]|uniref:primase-helicase family protein n=1 Tax=Brevundimonas sp. DC300-4 TaxID=2804594 RepID=UPI003CEA7CFA
MTEPAPELTGEVVPIRKPISSIAEVQAVAVYLKRIGARPRSFRTAVVERKEGRYEKTLATIHFTATGQVEAPDGFEPTDSERALILDAVSRVTFPTHTPLEALHSLPPELTTAAPDSLFTFFNDDGQIVMLQQRVELADGGKAYIPWTYWSDCEWRNMEPEGPLPIWGLDQLKDNAVVFIHEGAKAARAVFDQCEGKGEVTLPWVNEVRHAAHLGWIGGAHSVGRTDWEALRGKGIKRAYIVADNDAEGRSAVPTISRELGCTAFHVQFSDEWPEGFDLADPFPREMYGEVDGVSVYRGPSFRSCLAPATWATNETIVPPETPRGSPRRVHSIRPSFATQWAWVEDVDLFVHRELGRKLKRDQFNASVRPFSHIKHTADLLQGHYDGQTETLTYRPDTTRQVIKDDGKSALNLYRPALVQPLKGDVQPWLDFLAYVFPDKDECDTIKRWCATLVARPDIRMVFSLLLISEVQGIGKTTLGTILKELVGPHNASFPGESMIVETQFNGWLAEKRLIIVNEIYSSESWKAYNKLKSLISDDFVDANIKHQATYTIPNWAHFFMCSNHPNALKVERSDRRIFIPTLTETPWPRSKFVELRNWLEAGGYGRIMAWAQAYGDYVQPGQIAPKSVSKDRIIADSMRPDRRAAEELGQALMEAEPGKPVEEHAFFVRDLRSWIADQMGVRPEDTRRLNDQVLLAGLVAGGLKLTPRTDRLKVGKVRHMVAATFDFGPDDHPKLREMLRNNSADTLRELLDDSF